MLDKINITVSKNTMGKDYVQIMSEDMISVNIVLNAEEIKVLDRRE